MVSMRWLLALMLWLLPWLQMVKSGYIRQQFRYFRTSDTWDSMTIPKDGVYLVSLIASPGYHMGRGFSLQIFVYCDSFRPYFSKKILLAGLAEGLITHAEVAASLKKGDKLFLWIKGKAKDGSSFSVVYVAEPNSFYVTVKSDRVAKDSVIKFAAQLTPNGWTELKGEKMTTFSVTITGMYWVTARVNPWKTNVRMFVVQGSRNLIVAYGKGVKPISCSGAFHIEAGSTIEAVVVDRQYYESRTLLSFVYLAGNKKPNTYPFEHLAFTARYGVTRYSAAKEVLKFNRVETDYGYMYRDGYTEIRRSGTYMVSIRPYPDSTAIVTVTFYVNGKSFWVVKVEKGIPSGATVAISLRVGSYVYIQSDKGTRLTDNTLFSIAFIQP